MKKRIAYFVNVDWFFISHRIFIAQERISKGWDVSVFCCFSPNAQRSNFRDIKWQNMPFARGFGSPFSFIAEIMHLQRALRDRYDIVHFVGLRVFLVFVIAKFFMNFNGSTRVIFSISGLGQTFHSRKLISVRLLLIRPLTKFLIVRSNSYVYKYIVQNKANFEWLRDLGIAKEKIILVAGSGVPIPISSNQQWKANTDLKKPLDVIFVGRLFKLKGLDRFLDLARHFERYGNKQYKFHIFGEIDEVYKDYTKTQLEEESARLDCLEYHGFTNDKDLIYVNRDLMVCPTLYGEGLPKVVCESFAFGIPVVGVNGADGIEDVVKSGDTGFCVENNLGHFISTIRMFADLDTQKRQLMSSRCIKYAEENFDLGKIVEAHAVCYDE